MSNQGNKIVDKKKNDILKKFLNAQQYTKILKKNASNLKQDNYGTLSYDQMQFYSGAPHSAKLPSKTLMSKDIVYSMNTMNNDSGDFQIDPRIKQKKTTYAYKQLTQSSNQIPSLKTKKSSYSQMQKSTGTGKVVNYEKQTQKIKQFDVLSQNKEKHSSAVLHQSLGGMKTQSFFKLKSKKSFNYSNVQEYDSEKLSGQEQSFKSTGRISNQKQRQHNIKQSKMKSPYCLTPQNFVKLINKVEELESVILIYQQAVKQLTKKILSLKEFNNQKQMSQIFVDSLKEDLFQQKNKNAQLRQKIYIQQNHLKQYQQIMLSSIQKMGKNYEKQISQIFTLDKQNQFLKCMLRLQLQNPQTNNSQKLQRNETISDEDKQQGIGIEQIKFSKNMLQLKQKINKQKQKQKPKQQIKL